MFNSVRIVGFFSLLVSIQGLEGPDHAWQYLGGLAEEVEAQVSGVELLIQDGKDQLPRLYEQEQLKSAARSGQATREILALADVRGCPEAAKERISNVGYTLKDRFDDCLNLTQKIVDFEKICFEMYNEFIEMKPEVCNVANDMMLCFKQSIFKQIGCFSDSITTYTAEYKKLQAIFTETVEKIHQLVQNTKKDFIGCFENSENNVKIRQQKLLDQLCPSPRLGRFRI